MSQSAEFLVNELLVDIFDTILLLEEQYHREKGIKLTMNEIHVLDKIAKSPTQRMSDIAADLHVTQGTLTSTINRLEKKGYVSRQRDSEDRRIFRLLNSEKANEVLKVHDAFHQGMVANMTALIGNNQVVLEALEQLNAFFNTMYETHQQKNR